MPLFTQKPPQSLSRKIPLLLHLKADYGACKQQKSNLHYAMCHFLYLPHIVNYTVSNQFKRETYNIVWPKNEIFKSIKPFLGPFCYDFLYSAVISGSAYILWGKVSGQNSFGTLLIRSGPQQSKRSYCFSDPPLNLNLKKGPRVLLQKFLLGSILLF